MGKVKWASCQFSVLS